MRRLIAYLAAVLGLVAALIALPLAAASAHVRPVPSARGSVALADPIQYVKFAAFAHTRNHGSIDYTNFTYPANNSHVWNIDGTHMLTFASTYVHTMNVTTVTPVSPDATLFSGTGAYNPDPSYTWTVKGAVHRNAISFSILYTGTNAGYQVSGHGLIAPDGSVSGTAHDSNGVTLPFTMPAGSAMQVLSYRAPVTFAFIKDHNARFGFTIPAGEPAGLAGLHIIAKVHGGSSPTWAHGVATSKFNGPVTQYPITSGFIIVRP